MLDYSVNVHFLSILDQLFFWETKTYVGRKIIFLAETPCDKRQISKRKTSSSLRACIPPVSVGETPDNEENEQLLEVSQATSWNTSFSQRPQEEKYGWEASYGGPRKAWSTKLRFVMWISDQPSPLIGFLNLESSSLPGAQGDTLQMQVPFMIVNFPYKGVPSIIVLGASPVSYFSK